MEKSLNQIIHLPQALSMRRFKFKFVLHKRYFDTGLGLTSYVKYFIAFFGLASSNVKATLWIGLFYAIACYFVGMIWLKKGFFELEQEISNIHNKFVKEMRRRKI